jgi:hypothetical protein
MTNDSVLWAHIDGDGYVKGHGVCSSGDLQHVSVPIGMTLVPRPEEVNCFGGWRSVNNEWIKETA